MKLCMGCMEKYEETLTICPHCGYTEGTAPDKAYHMIPGSILAQKYIVGKTLGYGGFGVTYIGYDAELERKVAVKEYLPSEFSTRIPGQTQVTIYEGESAEQFTSGIYKFVEEAKRLAQLSNIPGIVQIYDSFKENDTAYIVMEYIEGETLRKIIDRDGCIPLDKALQIILPIVSSLKSVHAEGIIHRDIAPDNIMVSKDGEAKLIDFGASRFATTTHSKSLSVLIKPGFAPVEQYQSRGEQGPWTDVYALAATFYTMLTGETPKDSMNRMEKDDLKAPSKAGAKVSKNIDTAILNAMNLKVEERTASMEKFENELLSQGEVARLVVKKEKDDIGKWPVWLKVSSGLVAAIVICVLGITTFMKVTGTVNPFLVVMGQTVVPNMVNRTVEVAQTSAASNKIEIQIVNREYSDEIPAGYILAQNIAGGERVDEGIVLEVTVSAGTKQVRVPSVIGLTQDAAIYELKNKELNYTIEEVESNVTPGYVVSADMDSDTLIDAGTTITLYISKGLSGMETTVEVEIPDLYGLDYEVATQMLAERGIYLLIESREYSSMAKNKIIWQSVPSGNVLHQGDTVSLTLSLGKEQVEVPDVQIKTEEDARTVLSNAGLFVKVKYASDPLVPSGKVISQSIDEYTMVDKGSEITIVVSTGKQQEKSENNNASAETQQQNQNQSQTQPVKAWSEWVDTLPSGITNNSYDIETKTEYRFRDKLVITSKDNSPASQGYSLTDTKTAYSNYGNWSAWSTTAVTASDTRNVEQQTLYQYRTRETTTAATSTLDGWTLDKRTENPGAWSEWSETVVSPSESASGRVEVNVRENSRVISVYDHTEYEYYHYFYMLDANTYGYTYSKTFAENSYKYLGRHTTRTTNNSEIKIQAQDWDENGDVKSFWRDDAVAPIYIYRDEIQYFTEYQSRTVSYSYQFSKWSPWSEWSAIPATASATTEVNSQTQYRYQDRYLTYTYVYQKWGDYSGWSETPATASDTREVQQRTLYRYKEK